MRGSEASAVTPSAEARIGTVRQPAGSRPSARHAFSTASRSQPSRRKHIASPAPGVPVIVGVRGRRTPAPSPVTPSAAQAPRCPTAASPASARSSSSREARPRTSATSPMPQASRSRRGSWRRRCSSPMASPFRRDEVGLSRQCFCQLVRRRREEWRRLAACADRENCERTARYDNRLDADARGLHGERRTLEALPSENKCRVARARLAACVRRVRPLACRPSRHR